MPKTSAFEVDIVELIFDNTTLATIGDATGLVGSTVDGSLYVALLSGDPGAAGDLVNNELTVAEYGQYTRIAVGRAAGWEANGSGGYQNAAAITYVVMSTGTGVTATHFAICKESTIATDDAIYYGTLTAPLAISDGITPEFAAGALDVTEA